MEINFVQVEFTVRLPIELASYLKEAAERDGMSPADLVERIVREYVETKLNVEG